MEASALGRITPIMRHRRRAIVVGIVVLSNVLAWAIPNDVAGLVARERPVLLGRYSREHVLWNFALLMVSLATVHVGLARTPAARRRRAFQAAAVAGGVFVSGCLVDMGLRLAGTAPHYVMDPLAYRRPPQVAWTLPVVDRPAAAFSYPVVPEGYPAFTAAFRTDARGFRNRADVAQAEVLFIGDSFVEGSRVSDEQTVAVRFAELSGLSTYSLGMSGYSPRRYLAVLEQYGLELRPRVVVCLLYEGNDLRATEDVDEDTGFGLGKFVTVFVKQSPILRSLDGLLVGSLGRLGVGRTYSGIEKIAWLPFRVPDGPAGRFYAFAPKQITQGYLTPAEFEGSREWKALASILNRMQGVCRAAGIRLVLGFAPNKAHVALPPALDRLPAEAVRSFAAIASRKLPDAQAFVRALPERFEAREAVVRRWCESSGVEFVSLTGPLRESVVRGEQVYYTYDQHWTPLGHDLAARVLAEAFAARGLRPSPLSSTSSP
mgnify:CR=1 FL=1